MKEIKGFFDEYRFLSNFWRLTNPITDEFGIQYYTSEHYFMAHKSLDKGVREYIAKLETPAKAKKAGRKITLRPDWEEVKNTVMKEALRQKFSKNEDLKQKLLDTGDAYLEETNTWNDTCWGVCDGIGENRLGKLLMEVREELRNAEKDDIFFDAWHEQMERLSITSSL